MKNLALGFFFLLSGHWSDSLWSQNLNVGKGRFFANNGQEIKFLNLSSSDTVIKFTTNDNASSQGMPINNIVKIEKQTGHEGGKWALWCGLGGLVGSGLGVLQAQSQLRQIDGSSVNGAPIILGLTAVSALTGYIIGYSIKKYETVYTNPSINKGLGFLNQDFSLDLAVSRQSAALIFLYQF